ncbi:hypothetical protein OJ252_1073 [Cryptosporidium canis]|uniref:PH domain-containing protein n=1 Tax=Cryptosporidium canis TaxID=195482 RepID=A0ABQ8P9L8_9CRYT|nr:hypothetical protein OJ252_1073 [Cryptosporidium canis]
MSNSVSTSIASYEQLDEGELKFRDERRIDAIFFQNEMSPGNVLDSLPVITGYYGVVLRKKKHPLFGSYWSREYCLLQSNVLLCHELKYPYKIKKSVSVASISRCEVSKMDPCVYCLVIDNNKDSSKRSETAEKKGFSCFTFGSRGLEIIKIKCKSAIDAQKWTHHINNTMKGWKLNRSSTKCLYSANQFIEKTIAQELFERANRKFKRTILQTSVQNMMLIFKQVERRNLYHCFYRIFAHYITMANQKIDDESISSGTSSISSTASENESEFQRDLLLIKRRIVMFKIEQGSNHLKRVLNKKISEYWRLFVRNLSENYASNCGESEYMEVHYKLILKRRIFSLWRELLDALLLKNSGKQKYRTSVDSITSSDSTLSYDTNETMFNSGQSSPIKHFTPLSSSELLINPAANTQNTRMSRPIHYRQSALSSQLQYTNGTRK